MMEESTMTGRQQWAFVAQRNRPISAEKPEAKDRLMQAMPWVLMVAFLGTLFAFVSFFTSAAAAFNSSTHCHADGWPCVEVGQCLTTYPEPTMEEDDPCWLIMSPNSDMPAPDYLLRLFGAIDHREAS